MFSTLKNFFTNIFDQPLVECATKTQGDRGMGNAVCQHRASQQQPPSAPGTECHPKPQDLWTGPGASAASWASAGIPPCPYRVTAQTGSSAPHTGELTCLGVSHPSVTVLIHISIHCSYREV